MPNQKKKRKRHTDPTFLVGSFGNRKKGSIHYLWCTLYTMILLYHSVYPAGCHSSQDGSAVDPLVAPRSWCPTALTGKSRGRNIGKTMVLPGGSMNLMWFLEMIPAISGSKDHFKVFMTSHGRGMWRSTISCLVYQPWNQGLPFFGHLYTNVACYSSATSQVLLVISIILYYIIIYYNNCIILYHIILYYILYILYYIILYCIVLYYIILYYIILYYYIVLYYIIVYYSILYLYI